MITALVWLCVVPPALALLYFSAEIIAGLWPLRASGRGRPFAGRLVVVIPAHDESSVIAETLRRLSSCLAAKTEVLVIADNCSDDTAAVAAAAGARVVERRDPSRRGKGFALAFARDALAADPPDAVLVLDADCAIDEGSAEAMAAVALARGAPVQSINVLHAASDASPLVRLSNFAMLIKNLVRARGLYRLGGGVPLFGTGMTFPWALFSGLDLATSDTVEDLRLSIVLAHGGIRAHLDEGLRVTSAAAALGDSLGQRRRWEHGFLENARSYGLGTLMKGLVTGSRHLGMLGAHLLVPPLALLVIIAGLAALPALALALSGGSFWPAAMLAGGLGIATIATGLAWYREGRAVIGASALARAPFYVLWKIPLYLGFFVSRQREWNRTRRISDGN